MEQSSKLPPDVFPPGVFENKLRINHIKTKAAILKEFLLIAALYISDIRGGLGVRNQIIKIGGIRYYADRPHDCCECRFWMTHKEACRLGEYNCYYLAQSIEKPESRCDTCPYASDGFCVSASCYQDLKQWLKELHK